jgi:hypothetical protein
MLRNDNILRMSKNIHSEEIKGPNGETVKVSWFADKRVRFDFTDCGKIAITHVFPSPSPKPKTNVEINYGLE